MKKIPIEMKLNQKIRDKAKELGVGDVNRIRIIVVLERLIARLESNSYLANKLIFCGGFVLYKTSETNRFTIDADAIISQVSRQKLDQEINEALSKELNDGLWFGKITVVESETDTGHGNIRYRVHSKFGKSPGNETEIKKLRQIHLDISLGSEIGCEPKVTNLSSILDLHEPIEWKIYPIEFIASEKIHALISREGASTRAKDIYDLSIHI